MAEAILDKYPAPLTPIERNQVIALLTGSRLKYEGYFYEGNFTVLNPIYNTEAWASNLLRFDLLKQRLRINRGFINVHNYIVDGRRSKFLDVVSVIDPGNIRVVDDQGLTIMGPSGRLLDMRPYLFNPSVHEPEELDEILRETVLKGKKPPFFSHRPMARVGDEHKDDKLDRLDLGGLTFAGHFQDDIVVMKDGQLIGRAIEYPFDKKNWS